MTTFFPAVCFTFLSVTTDYVGWNGRVVYELERSWKQVACLIEVLSWHLSGGIQVNHENHGQDSWWPSWDLNHRSPNYKHQVLMPQKPTHKVWPFMLLFQTLLFCGSCEVYAHLDTVLNLRKYNSVQIYLEYFLMPFINILELSAYI